MHEKLAVFRLDATEAIGSGHAMRCMSIAAEVERRGGQALFVVSCAESLAFIERLGMRGVILDSDPMRMCSDDAIMLLTFCNEIGASSLLVDTYGASDAFFQGLSVVNHADLQIGVIDDLYSFEHGSYEIPKARDCDFVINYDFMAADKGYEKAYSDTDNDRDESPALLLGPRYAPIKQSFRKMRQSGVRKQVKRILITTGSTNPDGLLERLTKTASEAMVGESIEIGVVIGAMAAFVLDDDYCSDERVVLYRNVSDLSHLMSEADIVISAGGSTLYELACVGVPTIAIPIVQNQVQNVAGFVSLGLGLSIGLESSFSKSLAEKLTLLASSHELRNSLFMAMTRQVDGNGAFRIAERLLQPKC